LKLTHWILKLTIYEVIIDITCLSVEYDDFDSFISDKFELFAVISCLSKPFVDLRVINPCFPPMSILISGSITLFQVPKVPMREYIVVTVYSKCGVYLFSES
jgi:hypothetical protein